MIPTTLGRIAAAVDGRLSDADPDAPVSGPAFLDSRTPAAGGLFAAFAGEQTDGHKYAASAVAGGAAGVIGSRPTGVPTVVVDDVRRALQRLAHGLLADLRRRSPELRVVALTGSQGKTSVKDLLAQVLGDAGPTVATRGSFNNELGLPLTVLRADAGTRFLVLEMGARGIGHIAELCRIARPDVSVVLNVGRAHLGEFGSQENIARAKGELVEALGFGGVAVLNADDPLVAAMSLRTHARVTSFGTTAVAETRLEGVQLDQLGRPRFSLGAAGAEAQVQLRLLGEHQALNAAAAAATALALGLPLDRVAQSLESVTALSKWRMELHERADGLVVINDAYNANPDSMRAALQTLAQIASGSGRRGVAVLGEMLELGEQSAAEHAALGRLADQLGIRTLAVGAGAAAIGGESTRHVESVAEAIAWVGENVQRTDVVLVKASRGVRLERVADALLDGDTSNPSNPDHDEQEVGS